MVTTSRRACDTPARVPAMSVDFPDFVWIWNHQQGLATPTLHVRIARWLSTRWHRDEHDLLLLAFRSSGKSTLVGLYCAWLLLRNPNLRILVLAGDFALAKKMVRNVKRVIERHRLTFRLRPSRTDHWASDQFTVTRTAEMRDPSMLAKGISSNITGLRADVVICDDVEVPNTCDSPAKRADLRQRLFEIDYVAVPGGLRLFVGTPHTYYTIYAPTPHAELGETRPFLAGYHRLEVPIIDTEGRSLWPQRFSIERIEAIRAHTGPAKFDSQMLLKPRSITESRLRPEQLRVYETELSYAEGNSEAILLLGGRRLVSASCWWDPAYGSPRAGDASVVAALFTDDQGDYWLHRVVYLEHDPQRLEEMDAATQLCRQVVVLAQSLYLPAVSLEVNGLGRFLPGLLRNEFRRAGLGCAVLERSSSRNKELRIVDAFDAVLAAGRLWAHESLWQTPFIEEMREWRPGGKGRDDGLDAVAGCLLSEPVRLPRVPPVARGRARSQHWRAQQTFVATEEDVSFLR